MQEIPAVKAKSSDIYDQLRSAALVDMSSQSRAFSDFLSLMDRPAAGKSGSKSDEMNLLQDAPVRVETVSQKVESAPVQDAANTVRATAEASTQAAQAAVQTTAQTAVQTAAQAAQTAATAKANGQDSRLNAAKNVPVSREAFEEIRPALASLGMSDKDIEGLSARVKAGQLTWGQLVHTVSSGLTGAKKPVQLSTSQGLDLQSLFQKLGFDPNTSKGLVASVAKGEGVKVLAQIQQKLSTMPEDQTLNLDSKEMATLFKALRLPEGSANKLASLLGPDTTVAGLKGALDLVGQEMLQQRVAGETKDTELLRSLGNVMKKDVDKVRREAGLATSSTGQQAKDSDQPRITVEVKTPDRNDTKWFDKHDQKKRSAGEEAAWNDFLTRVKNDDSTGKTGALGQSAKDSLDALLGKTQNQVNAQQARTETSQQGKAWEKVAAPKLLNQVQEAMLKDLGQGRKQMTLDLDPANLGKLQVMLQVKDKDVHAVLRADDPETARMLSGQLETIKKALEDQGLKVQSLEVQTGLASRQDQHFFSADQHNQAQERQDLSNLFTRLRNLRSDGTGLAQEMQNVGMQAILSDKGLHVIA